MSTLTTRSNTNVYIQNPNIQNFPLIVDQTTPISIFPLFIQNAKTKRNKFLLKIQEIWRLKIPFLKQTRIKAALDPNFRQFLWQRTLKENYLNKFFSASINTSFGQYLAEKDDLAKTLKAIQNCEETQHSCDSVPINIVKKAERIAETLLQEYHKAKKITLQKNLEIQVAKTRNATFSNFASCGNGEGAFTWETATNHISNLYVKILYPDGSKSFESVIARGIEPYTTQVITFPNKLAISFAKKDLKNRISNLYLQMLHPNGINNEKPILIANDGDFLKVIPVNPKKVLLTYLFKGNKWTGQFFYNNGSFKQLNTILPFKRNNAIKSLNNELLLHVFNLGTAPNEPCFLGESCFENPYNPMNRFLRGQIINLEKNTSGNITLISNIPGYGDQNIIAVDNNLIMVVFENEDNKIYVQPLNFNETKIIRKEPSFLINNKTQSNRMTVNPQIISLENRYFVISWAESTSNFEKYNLYMQLITKNIKIGPFLKINKKTITFDPYKMFFFDYNIQLLDKNTIICTWLDKQAIHAQIVILQNTVLSNIPSNPKKYIKFVIGGMGALSFTAFMIYIIYNKMTKYRNYVYQPIAQNNEPSINS